MGYNIHHRSGFIKRTFESAAHAEEVHNRVEEECDCFCVTLDDPFTVLVEVEVEKQLERMAEQYRYLAMEGFEGHHVLIGEDGEIWAEVVGHGVHETMDCEIIVATTSGKRLPAPADLMGVKA